MNIKELSARTDVAERQIRYLIAEGFIPPPRGGRAHADYGGDHVDAINRYSRLRMLGFPPAAIRLLLEAKEGAPFPIAPGITVLIDPTLLASGTPVGPLVKAFKELMVDLLKEPSNGSDRIKTGT